tara:strand:+ start:377 stop:745 length:369 start_codon:yes stop_codon:yes gene_type:complete
MAFGAASNIGRAGEFFAAYKLQLAGLETAHVDTSCDLHVTLPSRLLLRLEVKTARATTKNGSYKFRKGGSDSDYYAMVALPEKMMRVFHVSELTTKGMTTLRPESFTQQAEDDDIARLMSLE